MSSFRSDHFSNFLLFIWGTFYLICNLSVISAQSQPSSSGSGSSDNQTQLAELMAEIKELIADSLEGVWCSDLMKLYR